MQVSLFRPTRYHPTRYHPTRYHPTLVALHWLLALLIVGALSVGFFVLAAMSNADPKKVDVLRVHMAVGMAILVLMVVRIAVRRATAAPAAATTRVALFDRIAPLTHYALYGVVLLMVVSGFALSLRVGLPAIVFGHSGTPLPSDFGAFAPFQVHAFLALVLAALIALHVAAAIYHHFVLKDGLLRRIWFGNRGLVR